MVFIKRHHLKPSGSNIFPCKQPSHIPLWLSQESFRVHFLLHDPEEQVQSPGPSFPSLHFLSQWYNSNDLILSNSWISKSILLSRLSRFAKEKYSTCRHLKSFLYTETSSSVLPTLACSYSTHLHYRRRYKHFFLSEIPGMSSYLYLGPFSCT